MSAGVTLLAAPEDISSGLADDVRAGLTATPKTLPSKYFYDAHGSVLFEQITELPEYYQTRTETAILEQVVDSVVAQVAPAEIVELGSGSSRKTRLLLAAMHRLGSGNRYVPLDVSEEAVREAAEALTADEPWLRVDGMVGDFNRHLDAIPRTGRALVVLLGSTIGNLHPDDQPAFVKAIAAALEPGDGFLLGVDLVPGPEKSVALLEAAYDDAAGVTAAFNRNVLTVLSRELGADVEPDAFDHVARYDSAHAWIEMRLRARRDLTVCFPTLDLSVAFAQGEDVRTEISCKFTRGHVGALFAGADLALQRWDTDPKGRFAVALGRR